MYSPPELIVGSRSGTKLTAHYSFDVWGVGAVLYRMVKGEELFLDVDYAMKTLASDDVEDLVWKRIEPIPNEQARRAIGDIMKKDKMSRPTCEAILSRALFKGGATINMAVIADKIDDVSEKIDAVLDEIKKAAEKFDSFNGEIKSGGAPPTDVEAVQKMIEAKLADVKNMIPPALPVPTEIEVKKKLGGLQKKVILRYICEVTKTEVKVESADWSMWLKASVCLVAAGMCVMTGDIGAATKNSVLAVKSAYAEYAGDPAELDKKIQENTFLTSKENDRLVEGLRKAKFFDQMKYDHNGRRWVSMKAQL